MTATARRRARALAPALAAVLALAAGAARGDRPEGGIEGDCGYAFERVALLDSGYVLQWTLRPPVLAVRIVTGGTGWAAIGWPSTSSTTGHTDFDVSFGAVVGGVPSIGDFYQDVFAPPVPDAQNDVTLLGGSEGAGTTLEFARALDTGDEAEDNVVVEGPLNLKWAYQPTSDDPTDNHVGFTRGRTVVEIVPPGYLFADGFENASACAWSLAAP